MSNATKCDRCGACYEYGGMTVGEEYDLCDGCIAYFEAWMERQPVTGAPERVTNEGEMLHDTREKLEADVRRKQREWSQSPCALDTNFYEVIGWLDRQAAITERECREYEDALREQHHKRIAELKAKLDAEAQHAREAWQLWGEADARAEQVKTERDELAQRIQTLEREIATLKEHRAANVEKLHELTDECAELRKYRDEWKGLAEKYRADSIAAQEETERYRAKLGDVLDALHEAERAAR